MIGLSVQNPLFVDIGWWIEGIMLTEFHGECQNPWTGTPTVGGHIPQSRVTIHHHFTWTIFWVLNIYIYIYNYSIYNITINIIYNVYIYTSIFKPASNWSHLISKWNASTYQHLHHWSTAKWPFDRFDIDYLSGLLIMKHRIQVIMSYGVNSIDATWSDI